MYLCVCRGITEADVRRAGYAGVVEPDDLIALFQLDAPSCCGRCEREIDQFVALARESSAPEPRPAKELPSMPQVVSHAARLMARSAVRAMPSAAGGRHRRAHVV